MKIKAFCREYFTAILIILGIFILTPVVKIAHDNLAAKTFTKDKWNLLKPLILKTCQRKVELRTMGDNFFEEDQNFYLFICDQRELVYRLDDNNSWTWGDYITDSDFFIYNDPSFLGEVIHVWEKSPDYQKHLLSFQDSQRKETLSSWILRQRDKLNNQVIDTQIKKAHEVSIQGRK